MLSDYVIKIFLYLAEALSVLFGMGIPSGFLSLFHDKREILDLESFNDELAFRISWDPLVGGGTKFCTYRL